MFEYFKGVPVISNQVEDILPSVYAAPFSSIAGPVVICGPRDKAGKKSKDGRPTGARSPENVCKL